MVLIWPESPTFFYKEKNFKKYKYFWLSSLEDCNSFNSRKSFVNFLTISMQICRRNTLQQIYYYCNEVKCTIKQILNFWATFRDIALSQIFGENYKRRISLLFALAMPRVAFKAIRWENTGFWMLNIFFFSRSFWISNHAQH